MRTRRTIVASALAMLVVAALGIVAAPPALASSVFTVEWTVIGIYPRTGPSMSDPRDGAALSDGTSITVVCEAPGAAVTSNVVSNDTIWEQLDNGSWLPNAFVNTGYNGWTPGMPRCDAAPAPSNPARAIQPRAIQPRAIRPQLRRGIRRWRTRTCDRGPEPTTRSSERS